MRERRRGPTISHDRWLVSYADFVTLLFAFFVVLYATAQVDKQKATKLSDAIQSAFEQLGMFQDNRDKAGGSPALRTASGAGATRVPAPQALDTAPTASEFNTIRGELERALAEEIKRNDVALHMEADGLVVSLREIGFFDSGSATIKPGAQQAFGRVAHILREHACLVRIEGHTDNVPIHTSQFASNWELSTARATSLVKSLIEDYDVPAGRLSAAGYAEFHPVSDNDNAKGRQLNRRVDVVILRTAVTAASATTAAAVDAPGAAP